MSTRKKFTVTREYSSLEVSPWMGKWRFPWRAAPGAPLSYTVRKTKAEIEAAALDRLAKLTTGALDFAALSPERRHFLEQVHHHASPADQDAVLAFLSGRKKSGALADAVARFMAYKTAKKGETAHLAQVRRDLEALAAAFPARMVLDITHADLASWWTDRTGTAGSARKSAIRTTLAMFWTWARKDGIAGNDVDTVADRLPSTEISSGRLFIFELPELEYLLATVEKEWFPLIVLGAFQGIRPEEIAPKRGPKSRRDPNAQARKHAANKPGLRWEHIDWQWNAIRIPREVSKTYERTMPLHPTTRAWLEAYGAGPDWTGPICLRNPTEVRPRPTTLWGQSLTKAFPARFPNGWETDALRHSFASYRNAILRNLPTVAEEMGTSVAMLHGHYHNPRTTPQGEAWFDFLPTSAGILAPYVHAA